MSIVYLNGDYLPIEEARVSILDRGFLFGDGVYEVLPVYKGKLFRLSDHLGRLDHNLSAIRIPVQIDLSEWRQTLETLISANGGGDHSLYIQITRGASPVRDHAFPSNCTPTILAVLFPSPVVSDPVPPASAVSAEDIRWGRCDIKAISLLANVLLRQLAKDAGVAETILIREGQLTEGAASNVFVVLEGIVTTPPLGRRLLGGITRQVVLDLAAQNGIPAVERDVSQEELGRADEIWLSTSTKAIVPIVCLDNHPVGSGEPGPVWSRMTALYRKLQES